MGVRNLSCSTATHTEIHQIILNYHLCTQRSDTIPHLGLELDPWHSHKEVDLDVNRLSFSANAASKRSPAAYWSLCNFCTTNYVFLKIGVPGKRFLTETTADETHYLAALQNSSFLSGIYYECLYF